jgi:gamma-glutamyltranspeptidase/glutathione hydrolase/leukotriene-C4 hydrolase
LIRGEGSGFARRKKIRNWLIIGGLSLLLVVFIIIVVVAVVNRPDVPQELTPLQSQNGAVAADNPACSAFGVDILKEGGNAIDAAVATCLCQGVGGPSASGIGGGHVMLIRLANGTTVVIDARETAPQNAYPEMFVANPKLASRGGLAVAVPGELKGLEYAWKTFGSGKISWSRLFDKAIDLAANGIKVEKWLMESMRLDSAAMKQSPTMMAVFSDGNGNLLPEGSLVKNTKLAETLRKIAAGGSDVFYNGELTPIMVNEINNNGGNITEQDFHDYTIKLREPLSTYFQGYKIIGSNAPFSGGALTMYTLNLLELFNLPKRSYDVETVHMIIESWKFAFSNRMALADPEFVNITSIIQELVSKDHASRIRPRIDLAQTHDPTYYKDLNTEAPVSPQGTTHMSVVDKDRNSVALTSTINLGYGSMVLGPNTGIIFNDEMDDFSIPGLPNQFGLAPSVANFVAPGKRPLSSMTPTIVLKNDQPYMVVGGSGGPRITTATISVILDVLAFGENIKQAIYKPRVHHQLYPNKVMIEAAFPAEMRNILGTKYKHEFTDVEKNACVQGIVIDGENLYSASDFRKYGESAGY